ncbi:MAG: single-stranded-DNA-specific exonuclease RecJ [Nitrospirota bacterium]
MNRRWLVNRTNPEYIEYVSKTASVSRPLAQILINRGIKTSEEIHSFLYPQLSRLSDPFDIPGMRTAVERILAASRNGERVLVHGDYDVDGLSATAIVHGALKATGIDSVYFIPDRMSQGYGFKPSSVAKAKQVGASLIITVDCGITAFDAADECRRARIDLIITDHHEPHVRKEPKHAKRPESVAIPDAVAVVNPKTTGPASRNTNLSGAGIAFKLVQALSMTHSAQFSAYAFLDLAALGTIADVVPLTDENRLIVKEGLKLLEKGTRPGIQALRNISGIKGKGIRTGLLLFTIIPRINAAGRIADSRDVVKLFLSEDEDESAALSVWMDSLNAKRQMIEENVYQEALGMLKKRGIPRVIVLAAEAWHRGVIGIVASRIAEEFCRPAFIISIEGDHARGSARSIPSFDICRALAGCDAVLKGFGGHKQAAGLELDTVNIPLFEKYINSIAEEAFSENECVPVLEIDAYVDLEDVSFSLTKEMEMLEPFGAGNSEPLFGSKGLEILSPKIVKNNHLKMKLRQRRRTIHAIGFDMAGVLSTLEDSPLVDAVFTPMVNEWNRSRTLQLNLRALRPSK